MDSTLIHAQDAIIDAGGVGLLGLYHWLLDHPGTNKDQCAKTLHMGKDRLYAMLAKLAALGLLACNRAYQGIVAALPGSAAGDAQPAECVPLQDGNECVPPQDTPAPPTRTHTRAVYPCISYPNVFKDNGIKKDIEYNGAMKTNTGTGKKQKQRPAPLALVAPPDFWDVDEDTARAVCDDLPQLGQPWKVARFISYARKLLPADNATPLDDMVWEAVESTAQAIMAQRVRSTIAAYFRGVLNKLARTGGAGNTTPAKGGNVFLQRQRMPDEYYDDCYKKFA